LTDVNRWLVTIAGSMIVCLGIWETFLAVLYPRAVVGPVTSAINLCFHRFTRSGALASGPLIRFRGPVLVMSHNLCWATLLLLGISLIAWPQLGTGITTTDGQPTEQGFIAAIYYSGYTITTLGSGDLVPRTAFMRLITITAAGLGFGFFTLVLAYVISIYATLARRNQFASEIDYRTARTGNSLVYLKPYLQNDDPSLLHQDLCALSSGLADLLESHHFYPALHYFRFGERRYAMSEMLRFCLEVSSVLRTLQILGVGAKMFPSEPVDRVWHASLQMLEDTSKYFVICQPTDETSSAAFIDELMKALGPNQILPAGVGETELTQEYQKQMDVWRDDLQALEVCAR